MKKIKKPRTVSDGEASTMLQEAGVRRVQTASYASHSLVLKLQARKGSAVPLDAEEAARQFWNRKTNQASALEDASLISHVPAYSKALQPTVDALTTICEHIVGAMEGWDTPNVHPCASEETLDSQNKSVPGMHGSADKRGADMVEANSTLNSRQARAGDTVQTGTSATFSKLVLEGTGAMNYNTAMRKATRCVRGGTPNAQSLPDAIKKGNVQAVKLLDLLKGEPAKGTADTAGARAAQAFNPVPDALAKWASRKMNDDNTDGLQRPWNTLAGPAFAPGDWFQGSSVQKTEVAELASQAAAKAATRGPDVSRFPRPSDRLAFEHIQEHDCTDELAALRKIRKPAQEFLDENLLRSVPVKVTYTTRELFGALDHTSTLVGAGGSSSLRLATLVSRVTTHPHGNTKERMNTFMKEVEETAVLLQGLKRQKNPTSAMRNLVRQAMAELQEKGRPRCSRASVFGQDPNPLMMHPVLDKLISVREARGIGTDVAHNQVEGDAPAVDANLPASLGTRALA